ncbi:threonine aldolase [Actinorhabdospora filicis]|uniref:Threonine aldolase n=1 Tax=Actinorhabdospora filicis TaxID=1785913 RepID=A0A9W6W112_9ACTN|nr:beta-eliminating lyase-related protein [Actinorhabdospora filicis]GLZ75382.1 threonine aldolase [Actinorhabdospora filicis]
MNRPVITRSLSTHSPLTRSPRAVLARLAARPEADLHVHGPGGITDVLETRVAALLGKERALFFPTGTMAQQVALRIHAEEKGRRTFGAHPSNHLDLWEQQGYNAVHGLRFRRIGDPYRLMTLEDLTAPGEPLAAVLWELPQREIGGLLPEWADLTAQVDAARATGAAAHLDGARLWEAQPYYERAHAEIAGLFDSVYVSLYKGLGGVRGAILAGSEAFVAAAQVWRWRLGGQIPDAWPLSLSALDGLDTIVPRMPAYLEHAREIAAALKGLDGVEVVPGVPQTPLFHVHLPVSAEAASKASMSIIDEYQIHLFGGAATAPLPGWSAVELSVGDNAMEFDGGEVAELFADLLDRARTRFGG